MDDTSQGAQALEVKLDFVGVEGGREGVGSLVADAPLDLVLAGRQLLVFHEPRPRDPSGLNKRYLWTLLADFFVSGARQAAGALVHEGVRIRVRRTLDAVRFEAVLVDPLLALVALDPVLAIVVLGGEIYLLAIKAEVTRLPRLLTVLTIEAISLLVPCVLAS